jgi:hypothetical protein
VTEGNITCTARVFEWDGTDWAQRGSTFNGEESADGLWTSISLRTNGNELAISATPFLSNGNTSIYQWNGTSWPQHGVTMVGETLNDLSGDSISLNALGNTISIGAYRNDGNGLHLVMLE